MRIGDPWLRVASKMKGAPDSARAPKTAAVDGIPRQFVFFRRTVARRSAVRFPHLAAEPGALADDFCLPASGARLHLDR